MKSKEWNNILFYVDGKLFWRIRPSLKVRVGDADGSKSLGYLRFGYKGREYKQHRVIWEMFNGEIPAGMVIDHINNDGMDNRIENLRLATITQNSRNSLPRKNTHSKYKGVLKSRLGDKWQAKINYEGKQVYLGTYNTEEEAAQAVYFAFLEYHREFALINEIK